MNWEQDPNCFFLQNLDTEFGRISLEKIGSDRGNVRCTALPTPGKHNLIIDLIPTYFFDESIAKLEINSWLKIATSFAKDTINHDFKANLLVDRILHGTFCIVTVGQIDTTPNVFAGYFTDVSVPKGIDPYLCVDYNDYFPRFFVNQAFAIVEAESWLSRRGQKNDFSQWLLLP